MADKDKKQPMDDPCGDFLRYAGVSFRGSYSPYVRDRDLPALNLSSTRRDTLLKNNVETLLVSAFRGRFRIEGDYKLPHKSYKEEAEQQPSSQWKNTTRENYSYYYYMVCQCYCDEGQRRKCL